MSLLGLGLVLIVKSSVGITKATGVEYALMAFPNPGDPGMYARTR